MGFYMLDLKPSDFAEAVLDGVPLEDTPTITAPGYWHIKARPSLHTTLLANITRPSNNMTLADNAAETRAVLNRLFEPVALDADAVTVTGVETWPPPPGYDTTHNPDYRCVVLTVEYSRKLHNLVAQARRYVPCCTPFGINPHVTLTYLTPVAAEDLVQKVRAMLAGEARPTLAPKGLRFSMRALEAPLQ
jgi:hypothetical protein